MVNSNLRVIHHCDMSGAVKVCGCVYPDIYYISNTTILILPAKWGIVKWDDFAGTNNFKGLVQG